MLHCLSKYNHVMLILFITALSFRLSEELKLRVYDAGLDFLLRSEKKIRQYCLYIHLYIYKLKINGDRFSLISTDAEPYPHMHVHVY